MADIPTKKIGALQYHWSHLIKLEWNRFVYLNSKTFDHQYYKSLLLSLINGLLHTEWNEVYVIVGRIMNY